MRMINGPPHQIMQEPHSLMAIVVAKNEEKDMTECVASASFADEALVPDSYGSDSTVAPSTAAGPHVVQTRGLGCGPQVALGDSMARCARVLSLNADERIMAALLHEIEVPIRSDARDRRANGKWGGVWKGLVHGLFVFFRTWVLRLGSVDGRHGPMLAVYNARYTVRPYLELVHPENPPRRPEFPA